MTIVTHGTVRGMTIELAENLGLSDGDVVEVQVRVRPADRQPGEGIARTAGALADDPYWDGIMAEIYQARKLDRRSPAEEE